MKTAREIAEEIIEASNLQGGFDTPDELEKCIEQIQLDAYKAGMTEAIKLIASVDYHSSDTTYNRQEYMRALETARDNKQVSDL